jgi:hypothetical protein
MHGTHIGIIDDDVIAVSAAGFDREGIDANSLRHVAFRVENFDVT